MSSIRAAAGCLLMMSLLTAVGTVHAQTTGVQIQAGAAHPSDGNLMELPNSVLDVLSEATLVASPTGADDEPVSVTVVLSYTDRAGFQAYLDSVNSLPAQSRVFLSPTEQADRFGPSQASYDATLAYLRSYGFSLTDGSANRLTITVSGTRGEAQRAFNLSIRDYQLGDRAFFANESNPRVPLAIGGSIDAVVGLSNLMTPQTPIASSPVQSQPTLFATSSSDFAGSQMGTHRGTQTDTNTRDSAEP